MKFQMTPQRNYLAQWDYLVENTSFVRSLHYKRYFSTMYYFSPSPGHQELIIISISSDVQTSYQINPATFLAFLESWILASHHQQLQLLMTILKLGFIWTWHKSRKSGDGWTPFMTVSRPRNNLHLNTLTHILPGSPTKITKLRCSGVTSTKFWSIRLRKPGYRWRLNSCRVWHNSLPKLMDKSKFPSDRPSLDRMVGRPRMIGHPSPLFREIISRHHWLL